MSDINQLAAKFSQSSIALPALLADVYDEQGEKLAKDWADIARVTAGKAGKLYPDSIDHEMKPSLGVKVEAGPNASMPQGGMGMGFEFGSTNQPPHLDGLKASERRAPLLERAADKAIGDLLP